METVEGLRYRSDDIMRMVNPHAVRRARRKEIEEEIINSEKLKVGCCMAMQVTLTGPL